MDKEARFCAPLFLADDTGIQNTRNILGPAPFTIDGLEPAYKTSILLPLPAMNLR
jgi:hypothetical protein